MAWEGERDQGHPLPGTLQHWKVSKTRGITHLEASFPFLVLQAYRVQVQQGAA